MCCLLFVRSENGCRISVLAVPMGKREMPVKLPQAIARCEASCSCPKDNITRRRANITIYSSGIR